MVRVFFIAACGVSQLHHMLAEQPAPEFALDDECSAGGGDAGGGACALVALQLRAAAKSEPAREISANVTPADAMACPKFTAGTCRFVGCSSRRGKSSCVNGACICDEGTCANWDGLCTKAGPPVCKKDNGKKCLMSCGHGQTCGYNHKCQCPEGTCGSHLGTCEKPGTCLKDSGASCHIFGCHPDRGPTKCVNGRCECLHGYCSKDRGDGYGTCALKPHPDYLAEVVAVNQDDPTFPKPHDKVTTGLSFSGGGARALTFSMGAYRALEDFGLMTSVDAISSVSGGTWASSIYMFANRSKEELLGAPTTPGELTLDILNRPPAAMGDTVTQSDRPFLRKVATQDLPRGQIWPQFVGNMILKPFGLDGRAGFFASNQEEVQRIRRNNPQLDRVKFSVPMPNRPKVFVMNGAIIAPLGYAGGNATMTSLQMSPDYTGSPFWPGGSKGKPIPHFSYPAASNGATQALNEVALGGGFVSTFAFGGKAPTSEDGQSGGGLANLPPPAQPFTLADAVGISSVAPAAKIALNGQHQFVVPQIDMWPVLPKGQTQPAMQYQVGDGGSFENSGLMPLLQRGARKAVMWISTAIPLGPKIDFCTSPGVSLDWATVFAGKDQDLGLQVAPMLSDKFGYPFEDPGDYYTRNTVFEQSELMPVLCELQKLKKAGKPMVHLSTQNVKPNAWWGIKGGWKVKLLVVYLDQSIDFEKALPKETRDALGPSDPADRTWDTSKQFARYPLYSTTNQIGMTEIIGLTAGEVNLLAAQSEYSVRQNEDLFREVLCPSGASGVCCRNPEATICKMTSGFTR